VSLLEATDGIGALVAMPSLRERVYDALEASIVDGSLLPGSHLREDDLAKRLGVSRNPVREALQGLVHEGFADHFPGKGVYVHVPTLIEVEEVFHVRAILESDSVRLAADRMTPGQLEALRDILARGQTAVESKDATELLVLNEHFHNSIVVAAGNSVLAKMLDSLQKRIRWYFASVVVARAVGSWDQHLEIYDAIAKGDGELAAKLMTQHVSTTKESIERTLIDPSEPAARSQDGSASGR
jgi:DNA-binding GntR family transcriptional regulator